jgi:phosphonatase-like hydrolase
MKEFNFSSKIFNETVLNTMQLVVFDMAGTTVDEDNVVYKILHQSVVEAGYNFSLEEVLYHCAGKEKHQAIKDVLASRALATDTSSAIFAAFIGNLDAAYEELEVKTFPGVEDLFGQLRQREIAIALNTGYNSKIANLLLAKLGWVKGEHFSTLVTADDVCHGRPHPEMIHLAMARTGVLDSTLTLKAGDSIIDIEEGRNAGCGITVGVTTGAQTRQQLATAQPSYIFDSLVEILGIL